MMAKARRWFMGGAAFDQEISARFGPLVEAALEGKLDEWATRIEGRLALVIVLDQFTRNMFRGSARTYAGDERALELALYALDRGLHHELPLEQRLFLTMPLRHAEDIALQARSLEVAKHATEEAAPELKPFYAMSVEQGEKYYDIIRRFGRFPHRNPIVGRQSTPEEEAFLVDWAKRAAPSAMREQSRD
jgi:uncharacterized protein (DUF924 family)